jgi:hypothetical protein
MIKFFGEFVENVNDLNNGNDENQLIQNIKEIYNSLHKNVKPLESLLEGVID